MPLGITAAAVGTAVAGGLAAGASIYGAHEQSNTAQNAATLSAQANAAALKEAEAQNTQQYNVFNSQQAMLEAQFNAEQNVKAPYRAAGANALSALGGILGVNFGAGYTPSSATATAPTAVPTGTTGTPAAPTSITASGNPTDPSAILAALQQNYASLKIAPGAPGSGPADINYYATKIAQTGGLTPQNVAYWFGPTGRIATDASKSGGGNTTASLPTTALPSNIAAPSVLAPTMAPVTNAFAPPPAIVPISAVMGGPS